MFVIKETTYLLTYLLTYLHGMKHRNQILLGDQTRLEENFTGSTTPGPGQNVCDTNANAPPLCSSEPSFLHTWSCCSAATGCRLMYANLPGRP